MVRVARLAGVTLAAAFAAACEDAAKARPRDAAFLGAEATALGQVKLDLRVTVGPDAPAGEVTGVGIRDDAGVRHSAVSVRVEPWGEFRHVTIVTDKVAPSVGRLDFAVDVKVGPNVERLEGRVVRALDGWQLERLGSRPLK